MRIVSKTKVIVREDGPILFWESNKRKYTYQELLPPKVENIYIKYCLFLVYDSTNQSHF
jgi:hypothetical protein